MLFSRSATGGLGVLLRGAGELRAGFLLMGLFCASYFSKVRGNA